MTTLRKSLADYLELRRGMGFKLRYYERRLGRFLSFVEERGAKKITTKLAIQFATHDSDLKPRTMAGRLSEVRSFARYQLAHDAATEVPPRHLLATESEIIRLLRAARKQSEVDRFPGPLWPRWRGSLWYCYFGLLAMTGMRMSEARHLRDEDIDWKERVLTLHQAKFGKSRLRPVLRAGPTAHCPPSFVRHQPRNHAWSQCGRAAVPAYLASDWIARSE
jgi:integrase